MDLNASKIKAIHSARQIIGQNPLYLDTETTGTGQDAEIVEICLIDDASQVIYSSLVRPVKPIHPDVSKIHGITNGMVRNAPSWLEIHSQISAFMDNRLVGVYNADFDLRMIRQSCHMVQLTWQSNAQFLCIMKLYAQYRGEWNYTHRDYRWHSLESAGLYSKIPLENSHRACDDARLARAVLHHVADQNINLTAPG